MATVAVHQAKVSAWDRAGSKTGRHRAAQRHREPYVWLGAGALTLGVGVALASGSGVANADTGAPAPSPHSTGGHAKSSPTVAGSRRNAHGVNNSPVAGTPRRAGLGHHA